MTTFDKGDRVAFMRNGHRVVGTIEHVPTGQEVWFRIKTISPIKGGIFEALVTELEIDDGHPTQVECQDKFDSLTREVFGTRPTDVTRCGACGKSRVSDDEACSLCGSGVIEHAPARNTKGQFETTTVRMRKLTDIVGSKPLQADFTDEEPTHSTCPTCNQTVRRGMVGIDDHLEGCKARAIVSMPPSHMMSALTGIAGRAWREGTPEELADAKRLMDQVGEDPFAGALVGASNLLKRAEACETLLSTLTPDLDEETPMRMAKALGELTDGYGADFKSILKTFPRGDADTGVVIVRDVPFASVCEHHVLPFTGTATVAYLPGDRIVGLSKIPRLVRAVTRRLQVQERIGAMIADALMEHIGARGAFVVLKSKHTCMTLRGVECPGEMVTSTIRGVFEKEHEARAEVLSLITK